MFFSIKRSLAAGIVSVVIVIYCFNFIPKYSAILATRTLGRQIADYCLNFLIFFVAIYLFLTLIIYLIKLLIKK